MIILFKPLSLLVTEKPKPRTLAQPLLKGYGAKQRLLRVMLEIFTLTGTPIIQVLGRSKERRPTYARHLAMYLLNRDLGFSIADLTRAFNRDHSSVLAGIRRIDLELITRAETRADYEKVLEMLKGEES